MVYTIFVVLVLLQVKHLLVDWIWQPVYEWSNKGTYGHPGGILHSGKNACGTVLCFWLVGVSDIYVLVNIFLIDYMIHYHTDYMKMNINRFFGWGATTHNEFWWLTGFDQYIHQMTYIGLVYYAFIGF